MKRTNRIEEVRKLVDSILESREEHVHRRSGYLHLYGVSFAAGMLARKRCIDPELAIIAGMLHDISTYKLGSGEDHHRRSAAMSDAMLRDTGLFSDDEISAISGSIRNHGDKAHTGTPFDELLKDADVLQHHYYDPGIPVIAGEEERLAKAQAELGLI